MNKKADRGIVVQVLRGHRSPKTAFIMEGYPYGNYSRLKCRRRLWLETRYDAGDIGPHSSHTRLATQTTDPRRDEETWNKPKRSSYAAHAFLVKWANGHVDMLRIGDPASPKEWVTFYTSGIWQLLTGRERARIAHTLKESRHRLPVEWHDWNRDLSQFRADGTLPQGEWSAHDLAQLPDLQADRWWQLPADTDD